MRIIVMVLLILYMVSPLSMFAGIMGMIPFVIFFTISLIGLLVITIALEIRNLLTAGSKLEERCFTFAGWFKLGAAILVLVTYLLLIGLLGGIAAIGGGGFIPGTISPGVYTLAGIVEWVAIGSMILGMVASIFAAIAFFRAKIPGEVSE